MKHYLIQELLSNQHKTTILVVGAGGTGSHVITNLAMMNSAFKAMDMKEIFVTAVDNDTVEEHNIGRQNFSKADIGRYKSDVCIERVNRFYGTEWASHSELLTEESKLSANIIISCVDNLSTRRLINDKYTNGRSANNFTYIPFYWIDFGNLDNIGQVIISTLFNKSLPTFFDEWPDATEEPNKPSCSMAESLLKQDLFVNKIIATHGMQLLYQLLKNYFITCRGFYMNLNATKIVPIPLNDGTKK